jgi:hypothetical protein
MDIAAWNHPPSIEPEALATDIQDRKLASRLELAMQAAQLRRPPRQLTEALITLC